MRMSDSNSARGRKTSLPMCSRSNRLSWRDESLFATAQNTTVEKEYETFVSQVRTLIVPIMEAIQHYGLKRRHLHKFEQDVQTFYDEVIRGKSYTSDLVITYQKRFVRYQESLFVFL